MTLKTLHLLLLVSLITLLQSNAQISITFPMENAVFQRNQFNFASLSIAGNYPANTTVSSVQARLINPGNESIARDWTTIQNNPTGGVFTGTLTGVAGGWYRLELRSFTNGNVSGTATLNRVGIGEVFLIAGQSNAQGLDNVGYPATDERVVTHNELSWYDNNAGQCDNKFPNYPSFSQITNSTISKTGFSSWCYGKLGDMLTSRLGVPVAFFNGAATSTSSINWRESSNGQPTENHYNPSQPTFCNQQGVPYTGLKRIMNYYASVFGVRAILWHHGETDNYINTTGSAYLDNMYYIINKSRSDFGSTIPWVISKATLFNDTDTQADIKVAQQNLGNDNGNKLFSGPDTDALPGPANRADGVHFKLEALPDLANLWNASLDGNFFSNATPITAKTLPVVNVNIINTEFQLTAPGGYVAYKWVRLDAGNTDYEDPAEATTQVISRTSGTYRCYLTDSQGNITFTQPVICGCTGAVNCNGMTYLSNMVACTAISGLGAVRYDQSHSGNPIKLKGTTYPKGIGCHANSEITYKLNGNFGRFISDIGIDDAIDANDTQSSAYFRVYVDNILKYQSPLLSRSSPTIKININVQGGQELKIITNQGPDNFNSDHTDWAGARLHCIDNQSPTIPANLHESQISQNCATLNWSASTDNMEVDKYYIYLSNVLIDSVDAPLTTYRIKNLEASYYYTATVRAKDYSGNLSAASNTVEIITLSNLVVAAKPQTINIGQYSLLETSFNFSCPGGTIIWSTGATTNSITVSPTVTTDYTAACKINECISNVSTVTVKVNPNCTTSYNFVSPENDFTGSETNLSLRATTVISAQNSILNNAKVVYQAGQAIMLEPGFKTETGTVFMARIAGCN
ncbi:NPCBM/NEW2 domain-containing protein [Emticicia soli]|uniref:NPCBM/NEW2 domain-containing protein n=1 Tax=Emticicia soli TaxID=2027878 RepID=A0ABW5J6F1_9BACT